jgi:ribosomal protein L22
MDYDLMDQRIKLRHVRTFVEVARQKSVMRASKLLNVSQPAVTKTIRELEGILGVSLVERDGRGIKITRYGEAFLRRVAAGIQAQPAVQEAYLYFNNDIDASAIANAENNHNLDVDALVVAEASVGKSITMKRFATRGRGKSTRILKPFSRLRIVVREQEEA